MIKKNSKKRIVFSILGILIILIFLKILFFSNIFFSQNIKLAENLNIPLNVDSNSDVNREIQLISASQSNELKIAVYALELYSKPLCSASSRVKDFIKSLTLDQQAQIKIIEVDSQEKLEILTNRVINCYQNPPEDLEMPFMFLTPNSLCLQGEAKIIDYLSIVFVSK